MSKMVNYKRTEKTGVWESYPIFPGWADRELRRLEERYPKAKVRISAMDYYVNYRTVVIEFDSEDDELAFIFLESLLAEKQ